MLVGYAEEEAMMIVAETTKQLNLLGNVTLKLISSWMRDYDLQGKVKVFS